MSQLTELPINPPPGVVKTDSQRVIEGRWQNTINVRFVAKKPQKIGGWIKAFVTATVGVPRTLHAWRDRAFNAFVAAGTYIKLYVYDQNKAQNDITPYRATGTLSNPFTTTSGSTRVSVAHTAHGVGVGDIILLGSVAPFAGITIDGNYFVTTVIDADHYTFDLPSAASSDGNDSFTKVLLHCNGTDTSTTFTDSNLGGSAHTWTANGNAQIDTADSKFGGASGLFDGTGDYVDTPDSADYAFGSGDFTVDVWFKIAAADAGGVDLIMAGQTDAAFTTTNTSFYLSRAGTGNVIAGVAYVGASAVVTQSSLTYTGSTNPGWHHAALSRSGGTLRLFIDGVLQGSGTAIAGTVNNSTGKLAIGRAGEMAASEWRGWLDEFRMSVGIARWTAAFTPPGSFYGVPNGGTSVTYSYEIPVGTELGAFGYGWGIGGWGLGTWGTARSTSTVQIEPRIWSLDHFGTLLIASYNGGSIYQFDPTQNQPWPRATLVSADPGLPTNVRALFITPERFIMALCDGMQVKWPSQGTIDIWTPAVDNTANIRTLTEGTKLVAGRVLADFISLVWTDAALYRFQYTGATYVYSSSMIAKDCGLISPNGAVTAGGVGYWMGQDNFWFYNGTVLPMPNVEDIRKWLFDQIDINMGYQCTAIYNPRYDEVFFFVTITGQTTPTIGLIYSIDQQCWAPLNWGRAGGTHFTQGDTSPYMGDVSGFIYQHDEGLDADGVALPYSMTLAPYGLSKGGMSSYLVEYMACDFFAHSGDVSVSLLAYDRLGDPASMDSEAETVTVTDNELVDCRISGRFIGVKFAGNSLGCYIRLGIPVAFIRKLGERS